MTSVVFPTFKKLNYCHEHGTEETRGNVTVSFTAVRASSKKSTGIFKT